MHIHVNALTDETYQVLKLRTQYYGTICFGHYFYCLLFTSLENEFDFLSCLNTILLYIMYYISVRILNYVRIY